MSEYLELMKLIIWGATIIGVSFFLMIMVVAWAEAYEKAHRKEKRK